MVPRTYANAKQTAHDVCHYIIEIEVPIVGEEALHEFGSDAQDESANHEGHVQGSAAIGINNPVEDDGKQEKRYEMEDFVVDISAELYTRETGVACQQ